MCYINTHCDSEQCRSCMCACALCRCDVRGEVRQHRRHVSVSESRYVQPVRRHSRTRRCVRTCVSTLSKPDNHNVRSPCLMIKGLRSLAV